jgi:hypothetical protein
MAHVREPQPRPPTVITVLSIALTVALLIAVHGLWERGGGGRAQDQVLLFNAATTATAIASAIVHAKSPNTGWSKRGSVSAPSE